MTNIVTKSVELIYQMDNDQLNQVIEAVKLKRTHLAKQIARSVMVGDIVQFEGRGRQVVQGKVIKVNPKTLVVQDSKTLTRWKVTASLVTPLGIGA